MRQTASRIEAEISALLASPSTSFWLKQALSEALYRDCVDVANDAELLAALLGRRCDALLRSDALLKGALNAET